MYTRCATENIYIKMFNVASLRIKQAVLNHIKIINLYLCTTILCVCVCVCVRVCVIKSKIQSQ